MNIRCWEVGLHDHERALIQSPGSRTEAEKPFDEELSETSSAIPIEEEKQRIAFQSPADSYALITHFEEYPIP